MDEENFYQDEFGQQSQEFYERMPDETASDGDETTTEGLADEDMAGDDMMAANTDAPAATDSGYEDAFRETLEDTDQVGDDKLIREAESDYTSKKIAEPDDDM